MTGALTQRYLTFLALAAVALWSMSIERRLAQESANALQSSDRAFDHGQLRDAIQSAQRASMDRTAMLPSVQQARDRLRAVAVGSEVTGRRRTALLAWSSLAATSFEPVRMGAGPSITAREAIQHIEGLLPRRNEVRDNDVLSRTHVAVVTATSLQHAPGFSAVLFVVAIALAAWVLSLSESSRYILGRTGPRQRLVRSALLVFAGLSWCIGWVFV